MSTSTTGKIDFHLHSYASNTTDYYAANSFSIPESYSDPIALYHLLKRRGMSLVTLTDHNSIDGVKLLQDHGYPDVFLSAEMTTTFPEDGCNIHITIGNVTERQFAEANHLRGNVYEMVAYLDQEIATEAQHAAGNHLVYFMTHPLMSTQNRPYGREGSLSVAHIEKAILLCNCLEVHNGARTRALNSLTWDIVRGLDRETIERLANVHGIPPKGSTPWLKSVVGGSDDHSGINPGETWTEFTIDGQKPSANGLVASIRARSSRPNGGHGGPVTIAHSILKLLYEGGAKARSVAGDGKGADRINVGGPLQALLKLVFATDSRSVWNKVALQAKLWFHQMQHKHGGAALSKPFEAVLEAEIYLMLANKVFGKELATVESMDERIFLVVKTLVNRIFAHYVRSLRYSEGMNIVATIKETVAMLSSNLFVSLPYLIAYMQQSADCQIARDARRAFSVQEPQKVVLITDTFFDVNGVSLSIKRMIREAITRDIAFTVVTCVVESEAAMRLADPEVRRFVDLGRLKLLPAVETLDFPQYDGLQIHFPPMLDLLKYLQESGFTKMQISTPGIVGVAGLVAAKLLQIETASTYHTSIPEYVENYTKDVSLEAITWKYMILFYHAVDEILVPSKYVASLLHKRGLRNRKLLILDRWVDVDRFQPAKRSNSYWMRYGIADACVKFVYVGRIAIEKNLHLLAQAYRTLRASQSTAHLIFIGEGPYRKTLELQLVGLPVTFTGYLHGEELATALASCDVKVFPSTTDTWGNAPLEAQASGVPVIVTDIGGPAELMQDGTTGIMVRGHDVRDLLAAMRQLMDDETRTRMGAAARLYAAVNRVNEPFTAVLDSEAYRRQLRKKRKSAEQREKAIKRVTAENWNPHLMAASDELTRPVESADAEHQHAEHSRHALQAD